MRNSYYSKHEGKGVSITLYVHVSSVMSDSATPQTVACQAPLSMRFPRQEHWNGFHFLLQGIFQIQGSNLCLLDWQADSLPLSHWGSPIALWTHGYFILWVII